MSVPYWRLSSFYLCYFAALGAFVPYWSLFLQQKGFTPAEIGQLSALLVGTKIIAPNLWGWIADRTHRTLTVIRWTAWIAACLFAGFLALADYAEFAWLTIVFSFFWNAPLPLFEATTLSHLHGESHRYSRIRLWGSVGFILAVLGVGRWLEFQTAGRLPILVAVLLGTTWLSALVTPQTQSDVQKRTKVGLGSIVFRADVLAFLAVNVLVQIAHAPYYVFFTVYLNEHLYSSTVTGLLWSLGVVAEIVLFLLMKWLLRRFSLRSILLSSLLLSVARWLLIGNFVDRPGLMILAQVLHAATFGGTHIAAIHFIHRFFDRAHQAKGQALYQSLSFGVGGMLGSYLSGAYWESFGSHIIYTVAAISCGLAFIIAFIWVGREQQADHEGL